MYLRKRRRIKYMVSLNVFKEEKDQIHGNICCRNVLLFTHEARGGFIVKLADPGMVHLLNANRPDHPLNVERFLPHSLSLSLSSSLSFSLLLFPSDDYLDFIH